MRTRYRYGADFLRTNQLWRIHEMACLLAVIAHTHLIDDGRAPTSPERGSKTGDAAGESAGDGP